jgi:hypothetical protein
MWPSMKTRGVIARVYRRTRRRRTRRKCAARLGRRAPAETSRRAPQSEGQEFASLFDPAARPP